MVRGLRAKQSCKVLDTQYLPSYLAPLEGWSLEPYPVVMSIALAVQ